MKRSLWIVLVICTAASPALAARTVYLKEGGTITAKSVWRTNERVHVLVNRDTLTDFPTAEIDLKRTFPRKQRVTKRPIPAAHIPKKAAAARAETAANQKKISGTSRFSLPDLPKLTDRRPESLAPTSGAGGTIRQHNREMEERINE